MVELLVIMAIIGILTAITLQAVSGLMAQASRSRAKAEIRGMETSLEGYKTDNGGYPVSSTLTTNNYTTYDGSGTTPYYISSAEVLYQSISGKTNFTDTPIAGTKSYGNFKLSQLGNPSASGTATTYVQDPWTYAYGYSTGTTAAYPYNGNGFFDLWSSAGQIAPANTNTVAWIANWPNQ
jgi:type II secretory pathway pseudopilin PulG